MYSSRSTQKQCVKWQTQGVHIPKKYPHHVLCNNHAGCTSIGDWIWHMSEMYIIIHVYYYIYRVFLNTRAQMVETLKKKLLKSIFWALNKDINCEPNVRNHLFWALPIILLVFIMKFVGKSCPLWTFLIIDHTFPSWKRGAGFYWRPCSYWDKHGISFTSFGDMDKIGKLYW